MPLKEGVGALRRLLPQVGFRRYRAVRQAIIVTKRGLGSGLYHSGALQLWRRRRRSRGSPIILMYHSVGGRGLSPDIVVSQKHFEAHIRYVRRHYRLLSLENAVKLMEAGQPVPLDAIVVTLDDGYRDTYTTSFPILKRYECPATVFVTVEPVETGRVVWPQSLWRCLKATRQPELRVVWRSATGATLDRVLPLGTEHERAEARSALKKFAGGLGAREREDFLKVMARDLGCSVESNGDEASAVVTWDQLREMHGWGISIGSHTMTHPRLSSQDKETVRHELTESRRILSRELETEIRLFAYPFGRSRDFNEDTKRAVVETGYAAACSALVGKQDAPVDVRALDRVYVPDEPVWRFALRLLQLETESRPIAWMLRENV